MTNLSLDPDADYDALAPGVVPASFEAFLNSLREPDTLAPVLSARRYVAALNIDLQTLADQAHVHRNTVARAAVGHDPAIPSRGDAGHPRRDGPVRRPAARAFLVPQRAAGRVRLPDGRNAGFGGPRGRRGALCRLAPGRSRWMITTALRDVIA